MLHSLGKSGTDPKIFRTTRESGIPLNALLGRMVVALVILGINLSSHDVYDALGGPISTRGFIDWLIIALSYFRFRKAFWHRVRKCQC
jgi:amino acid permease